MERRPRDRTFSARSNVEGLGDEVGVVGGDVLRDDRPLVLPLPDRPLACGLVLVDARPAELLVTELAVFGLGEVDPNQSGLRLGVMGIVISE